MVKMAEAAGASDAEALAGQLMLLITGAIVARHSGGDANAAATGKVTAEILVERYCRPKAAGAGKRATPAR